MTTIQDLSNLESGLVISPWIAKIPGDMTFPKGGTWGFRFSLHRNLSAKAPKRLTLRGLPLDEPWETLSHPAPSVKEKVRTTCLGRMDVSVMV
ncbi:MAG: hypothetical protein D4R76_00630 [Methylococcus sp.]|nr:MAG: hypothetical protein D4R76_00630 [Methylococcus sp.]